MNVQKVMISVYLNNRLIQTQYSWRRRTPRRSITANQLRINFHAPPLAMTLRTWMRIGTPHLLTACKSSVNYSESCYGNFYVLTSLMLMVVLFWIMNCRKSDVEIEFSSKKLQKERRCIFSIFKHIPKWQIEVSFLCVFCGNFKGIY